MKTITDAQMISRFLALSGILEHFSAQDLDFQCFCYQKGEILCSPLNPIGHLLFLISGSVQIYDLKPDGRTVSISIAPSATLFGDLEYCNGKPTPYFVEALEEVQCLALPIEENRAVLDADLPFQRYLLHVISEKFEYLSDAEANSRTLEEKVIFYLRHEAEGQTISGVEKALIQLSCSRRQLQRVLKKLCDEGTIVKLGKGQYQLAEPPCGATGHSDS